MYMPPNKKYTGTWYTNQYKQQYCTSTYFVYYMYLDRFLWEHKVARKVKVSKLFSQLFSCTLFMGAKSCEKSLETFALDHNPAIWSKSLQTFLATEVATKVARRKLYRFGCPCYCQILVDCSLGSHNPIHKHTRVRAPHRRTPHETWRASTTSQKRQLSQQQLQQPARVHEIGLGKVAREGRRAACFGRWA